jgi:hypothetical protein
VISIGAASLNIADTPMSPAQKPAGAVVSFPRPKGAKFKKGLKISIKVMRWILILLRIFVAQTRRELGEGEFVLDEQEMKNTYLENGALMWRGRRLMQIRSTEVNKVEQASFDKATNVSV